MNIKNNIFISYAGRDQEVAEYLVNNINKKLGDFYYTELVENIREGDTTFTENVIKYFKKCNVFFVIITSNSVNNQFVNQEWGYAKSLKEIGQIQIVQHITEKYENAQEIDKSKTKIYDNSGRIISKGFISSNMMFIDLKVRKGKYILEDLEYNTLSFLSEKQNTLRPIFTEIQHKLERYWKENENNNQLLDILLRNKVIENLELDPNKFSYDYALQILDIGHLLDNNFILKVERYIELGKELNDWKDLQMLWIMTRSQVHLGNTTRYFQLLNDLKSCSEKIIIELEKLNKIYYFKTS